MPKSKLPAVVSLKKSALNRPSVAAKKAAAWADLLATTEAFRAAAPWATFSNLQYFGVTLAGGELALACVLGNGGESFGLSLYLEGGVGQAVKILRDTHAGKVQDRSLDVEWLMESTYLHLEFVERSDLLPADQKLLAEGGWMPPQAVGEVPPYPLYCSAVGGAIPAALKRTKDVVALSVAMRQVMFLATTPETHAENAEEGFWATQPDRFPFLVPGAGGYTIEWRPMHFERELVETPFAAISAAKKRPSSGEVWEIAQALATGLPPQKEPGSTHRWFSRMMVVGRFLAAGNPVEPLTPMRSAAEGSVEVVAPLNLLDAISEAGARPTLILVEDPELLEALGPVCATLGIELKQGADLSVTGVLSAVRLARGGFEDDSGGDEDLA